MAKTVTERLKKDTLICAEGYLFELERRGYVKAGAYVPEVVLDNPDALRQLHREFLSAGSDVMVAFTYYAHRSKMRTIDREKDIEKLNRQALKIAKQIAKEGNNVLVAGNICNTWMYNPDDHDRSSKIIREMYDEQVRWAAEEGVDFIVAETIEYVAEGLIALEVIKKYGLPAVVTFGPRFIHDKAGQDWIKGCQLLEQKGADVVGFNCIRGPATMLPLLKKLREAVKCPVSARPVTYRTTVKSPDFLTLRHKDRLAFPLELEHFLCTRNEMADFAHQAQEIGVSFIGTCCGASPYHVRAMAEALGRKPPASKYSPDLTQHEILGTNKVVKKHEKKFAYK